MSLMILGLLLFLGIHSTRVFADGFRSARIAQLGDKGWKLLYTALSLAGFVLLCWGYALARQQPVLLWSPPPWTRHVAALLMLPSFVLVMASQIPGNAIKHRLQHPMLLGTKIWALAHLMANGTLADVLLFGSFLVWAILTFRSARQRGESRGRPPTMGGTLAVVGTGTVLWLVFAFWAHRFLIGVSPFGR
jgi:uncharacterized membrane protein